MLLPLTVHTEDGAYGQGDVFEKDFSPEDEAENLRSGLLELVPMDYDVVGGSVVLGAAPGMKLTYAMPMVQEQRLIAAGAIQPAKAKPKRKADRGE